LEQITDKYISLERVSPYAEISGTGRARRRTLQEGNVELLTYTFLGDADKWLGIVVNNDDLPRIAGRRMCFEELSQEERDAFLFWG